MIEPKNSDKRYGAGLKTTLLIEKTNLNLIVSLPVFQQVRQQPDTDPGSPLRRIRPVLAGPGGPGNIKMHPGIIGGKLLQKISGSDGPGRPATRIFDIRDIAFNQFAVLFEHRQLPHLFTGPFRSRTDPVDQREWGMTPFANVMNF